MRIWAALLLVGTLRLWMTNSVFVPLTFFKPCMSRPEVLSVDASGEEVADTCFCVSGWVHDRVCEMVGKEVCVV